MGYTKRKFTQFITGYFRSSFLKIASNTNMSNKFLMHLKKHSLGYFSSLIMLIFGCLLFYIPGWFVNKSINPINYNGNGQLGDLISGTTMPFIAFAGIILTFIAFYIQYLANVKLKKDIDIGRIETKYYEMLKIHNENLKGIKVSENFIGRIAFEKLFFEYKYIFFVVAFEYLKMKEENNINEFSKSEIGNIAYKLFFHGIKMESNSVINYLFSEKDKGLVDIVIPYLDRKRGEFIKHKNPPNEQSFSDSKDCFDELFVYTFEYIPFNGYSAQLSQYYRHLFQTVKYIDKQDDLIIEFKDKYKYIMTIRAQLSNYEQLMLYYNSLSVFGWPWNKEENDFIQNYRLIRNIPLPLATFGVDPQKMYKDKIDKSGEVLERFFEWETVKDFNANVIEERIAANTI